MGRVLVLADSGSPWDAGSIPVVPRMALYIGIIMLAIPLGFAIYAFIQIVKGNIE